MFRRNKLVLLIGLLTFNAIAIADSIPHFNVQMENQSEKNASISFQKSVGNVSLQPTLDDLTPLPTKQQSIKYKVYFDPLTPADNFNIVFTGKQSCTVNVGYYAPGRPKVIISGLGCRGAGYRIIDNGSTLLLYITDINLK